MAPSRDDSEQGRFTHTRTARSFKAGLKFPVSRVLKGLKRGNYANRIRTKAAVYLTAAIEFLVVDILELTGNAAVQNRKLIITPRHIQLAIRKDDELDKLFSNVMIAKGGVLPHFGNVSVRKSSNNTSDQQ